METNLQLETKNRALSAFILLVGGFALAIIMLAADLLGFTAPGFGANQTTLIICGTMVGLVGATQYLSARQAKYAEWALLFCLVAAICLAAEMFIVGGLPGLPAKAMLIIVVAGSAAAVGIRHGEIDWRRLLSFEGQAALKFAGILVQIILLALLIRQFELENQAFYAGVILLALYGFIAHYFLPQIYRLPFFIILSIGAFLGVLGWQNGAWLIAIGVGLIGLCHLPISFWGRVGVVTLAGIILTIFRADLAANPIPGVIWPILGAIFMFRLAIYLYDLRTSKQPVDFKFTVAYFFLLPNIVFPFFPVVDFSTFRRTYYKTTGKGADRHRIYQSGAEWMLHGALQLILYRAMNYHLTLAPEQVSNAVDLAQFAITNFLLYLRVSGQFHIIVGLLHLFGFNLPETNRFYLLSSSFTDLWRRINIYWKDFMQKIIFYPVFFKLDKWSNAAKLTTATAVVFIATWFLHAYQWFWLRGSFLLVSQDVVFWTILALLVIVNTLYEARKGRQRVLGKQAWGIREVTPIAFKIAGTFSILIFLWSLWTSNGVSYWLKLWSVAFDFAGILTLLAIFLTLVLIFAIALLITKEGAKGVLAKSGAPPLLPAMAKNAALIALPLIISYPTVYNNFGTAASTFLSDLRVARLSNRDAELLQRGYYEDLMGVNRFNADLWDVYSKRPTDWPLIQDTELARITDDFYFMELAPNIQMMFHGERFSTNQGGFRDQEYALSPPANSYRVAIVGPSFVMGSGVADDEIFEAVLEERLNIEDQGQSGLTYQFLNFGVSGHSALQELYVLETRGLAYSPDAIYFVAHQLEEKIIVRNLAERIQAGVPLPYPFLEKISEETSITNEMSLAEATNLLRPRSREILVWTYGQVVALARQNDIEPVWVFMPTLETPLDAAEIQELAQVAEDAGFVTIDLSAAYQEQSIDDITVAEWDKHPNALGHQLIADLLYDRLTEKELIP